jgi:nitronate monooxygenase
MPTSWNRNRLTEKLGIDHPVIQGPRGGLSSQRLTAAVSNFGGLGAFGAHGLTPEAIKDFIAEIRSLTSKPFAMNLWVSTEDKGARTSDEGGFNRSLTPLAVHLAAFGLRVRRTNRIRPSDLKIRLACCWTRMYRYSVSFTEFRRGRF